MKNVLKKALMVLLCSIISICAFAQESSVENEFLDETLFFTIGDTTVEYKLSQDQIKLLDKERQSKFIYYGITDERSATDQLFVVTLYVHTDAEEFYRSNNYSYTLRIVYNLKTHSGRLFLYTSAPVANIDDHVYNAMRVFKKFNFECLNKDYIVVRYNEPIRRAGYYILEFNCSKF